MRYNKDMDTTYFSEHIVLKPQNNKALLNLCGKFNENLRLIEERLTVQIKERGYDFVISGAPQAVTKTSEILALLYQEAQHIPSLTLKHIHLFLKTETKTLQDVNMDIRIKHHIIKARGDNQTNYIRSILQNDINFGIGPAGTGKTYLAVACAVSALESQRVSRIVLVRPIVEAGEKLGFLPGDLAQKVHPYLRPLYDALHEMLGFDNVANLMERDIIELVPLAYMRGRSLNDSYIILDEAQNTTAEQMKMFLTRIGFNSKAVITGDITQIDLANRRDSGLIHAMDILRDINGISFTKFQASDVVRHPLVQRIVEAYETHHAKQGK